MSAEHQQLQSTTDRITASMDAEHARIHAMWEQTGAALYAEDFGKLHRLAGDFIGALKRHINAEEQILFPAIEKKTNDIEPTGAMRLEHRQMEHMLERLKPLLTVEELWTGIKAVEGQEIEPGALLRSHENKEHEVLYPMADEVLGADEARQLIARMRTEVEKS